jgi:putative Mn2+ efflux pump MntP
MSDLARLTLDRIERSQRNFKLALAVAVTIEALLIGVMVFLTDFADRVQALVFVSAVGGYTLIALGLVILATHVDRTLLRALRSSQ